MTTITEKFDEFVKATTFADFPSSAVEIAKLAILDNVGSVLAAHTTDVGRAYLKTKGHGVNGSCTIIGISRLVEEYPELERQIPNGIRRGLKLK